MSRGEGTSTYELGGGKHKSTQTAPEGWSSEKGHPGAPAGMAGGGRFSVLSPGEGAGPRVYRAMGTSSDQVLDGKSRGRRVH